MKNIGPRVFLSVGMRGKTDEQIKNDISAMVSAMDDWTKSIYITPPKYVDNFKCVKPHDNTQKAYYLGEAIKALGDCDGIVLEEHWRDYPGCVVEYEYAKQYGLDIFEIANSSVYRINFNDGTADEFVAYKNPGLDARLLGVYQRNE